MGNPVAMKPTVQWDNILTTEEYFLSEDDVAEADQFNSFTAEILDAKYEVIAPELVAEQQKHLSPSQQEVLQRVLETTPKLFDGE
eukprot:11162835-Ditylum_brightwellii.AAC.1